MPRNREEDDFKAQVIELAQRYDWLVAHHPDSRHLQGDPGLPDLILARGGVVIFAELKSEQGRLSDAQERWFAALHLDEAVKHFGYHSHETRVWRPSDLEGDVLKTLRW